MIKERAVSAVERILKAAGYDVDHDDSGIDLTAYCGDECIVVLCSDNEDEIRAFATRTYKYQTETGYAYCTKLLFTMLDVRTEDCIVWGHESLAKYAGQAIVAEVLNARLALDLTAPVQQQPVSSFTDNYQDSRSKQSAGPTTLDDYGPELTCLPESITIERARKMAGIQGEVCRVYIPYFLYKCESRGEKICGTCKLSFDKNEYGLINAVSGTKMDIEPEKLEKISPEAKNVSGGAKIVDSKTKKADISETILRRVVEELTKSVRVNHADGDAMFYEDIKVAPDPENIKITAELVYLPVVQVRGDKIIEIDLFSGTFLEEPVDDGVEVF